MQTTSVYIELVIIGAEVCTWVFTIFALIDDRVVSALKNGLSFAPTALIFLGVCYVVGIIFDRIANMIFKSQEKKIRKQKEISNSTVANRLFKSQDKSYFESYMSRKRIVRGTALNVLPITIALTVYLFVHHFSRGIIVAVIVCGIVFFALCLRVYYQLINAYYNIAKDYVASEETSNKGA